MFGFVGLKKKDRGYSLQYIVATYEQVFFFTIVDIYHRLNSWSLTSQRSWKKSCSAGR